MRNGSRRIRVASSALSMAILLAATQSPALAKPKQGSGGGKCGCACTINSNDYPGGGIVTLVNYNNPAGYACSAFNGATCSASDPATGGVRTGTVGMCGAAWTTVSITYSPFTGLSVLHGSAGLLPR